MANDGEFDRPAQPAMSEVREKVQCLIAPRRGKLARALGVQPLSAASMAGIIDSLSADREFQLVREIKPRQRLSTLSTAGEALGTYVVRMGVEGFLRLREQAVSARPDLCVEVDARLDYGWGYPDVISALVAERLGLERLRRTGRLAAAATTEVRLRVVGEGDAPVRGARVRLDGFGLPVEGDTDEQGEVVLRVLSTAPSSAQSLFVDPPQDYWTHYVRSPALSSTTLNLVRLRSFRETLPDFPRGYRGGWGQRAMGLDGLPPGYTGAGARIAIIDSGADNQHPILTHLQRGLDLTGSDPGAWNRDIIGHGSHCAGIITGRASAELSFRGFAPEAEVHVLKVFPGGQFSSLLEALDYCIEHRMDVVNMSLGSADGSEIVDQKLEEAADSGVACIVAAGNSGGAVQYPARSPHVLSVAAVGMLGEFPESSWESQTVSHVLGMVSRDRVFSPAFTCFGPKVDLAAPGVGIVSSVPGGSFDAQSGTSMAAPHVTGLAALLVAHHAAFGSQAGRDRRRVDALYQMLRELCPSPFSTAYQCDLGIERAGAGVPTLHKLIAALESTTTSASHPVPPSSSPSNNAPAPESTPAVPPGLPHLQNYFGGRASSQG